MFCTPVLNLDRPFEMHERCPKCHADYFPEPGFYYGAMFTSYFLSGGISLTIVMVTHWVLGWTLTAAFFFLVAIVGLAYVWWFRFSRALWLNLMVRYRPEKARLVGN